MSELTILLTSYNRPFFVQRALDSLQAQTCPDWRCIVLDDNSNPATLDVLQQYNDPRIDVRYHQTTDEERTERVRYAVLINSVLPDLDEGIVGYLCDNVEYNEYLVETVLRWFEDHPERYSGYVLHERDAWDQRGIPLGPASLFGHWDYTPPEIGILAGNVTGLLDHSQVFHRLPAVVPWCEDMATLKFGDGVYISRMIAARGPIWPILSAAGSGALTKEHLFA